MSPAAPHPLASASAAEALLETARSAALAAEAYRGSALEALRGLLAQTASLDERQHQGHGFAWIAAYVETLRALLAWAEQLQARAQFGHLEQLMLGAGFGEYLRQICGGVPMSQVEFVRPDALGLEAEAARLAADPACAKMMREGHTPAVRAAICAELLEGRYGAWGLEDETLTMMAEQYRRFVEAEVAPAAHRWHVTNSYIPLSIVSQMGALGVFGLTVPEEWGGSGLGKLAMAVASEELSRGYIGVGSLGTRAEIAAELIRLAGTPAQKERYLPSLASGEMLAAAVFTEPDTGSDLASLRTRADLTTTADGRRVWRISGAKTWITHAARADLMTLLVRTDPTENGYRGLSILLAEKPRGDDAQPFPAKGMSGSEIEVLGYRGMKEFEISFDGFEVPEESLLGGQAGQGFKQLMQTFESARIQTAARAVGVAQNALELGVRYAGERRQFGKPLSEFPRVADKLAWMAVETMMARQITFHAARRKDEDLRCDIEAGMAKLLAARIAWSNADCALQIHGGNGFAIEYAISRVLCDARILSIFEGAAEIQAQIIARGFLER